MKLALGIVTYNNSDLQLKTLLTSIHQSYTEALQTFSGSEKLELQILAIDNGQQCFEKNLAAHKLPKDVTSMTMETMGNIGFGRAMNALMKHAFKISDAFVAINPDGQLHKNCLKELIKARLKFPDALLEARQFPEEHPKHYSPQTGDTLWATGACLLIPKSIFDTTGGFDENLFLYGEDVDLSWQARCNGFKVKVVHDAIFIHSTLGRVWSKEAKKFFFLSYVYLAAKWSAPGFQRLYEKQFLARFDAPENRELMQKTIALAYSAKAQLKCNNSFSPEFDESRMLGPARWGY